MFRRINEKLPFTVAFVNGLLTGLLILFFENQQTNWFYLTLGIVVVIVAIEVTTTYQIGSDVVRGDIDRPYNTYLGALLGLSLSIMLAFLGIYLVNEFIPLFFLKFGAETSVNQVSDNSFVADAKAWLEPESIVFTLGSVLLHYLIPLVLANLGAWFGLRTVLEHISVKTLWKGISYSAFAFPLFFCGTCALWTWGQWVLFDSFSTSTTYIWAVSVSLLAVGIQFDFLGQN